MKHFVEVFIEEHWSDLLVMARRSNRDHDDPDEIVGKICADMWERRDNFPRDSNLRGWAYRVMCNMRASDQRRNMKKRGRHVSLDANNMSLAAGPEWSPDHRLLMEDVVRLFGQLPPEQQQAVLKFASGMSYEQCSRDAGVSLVTIKNRLCRARARMRAILEREIEGDSRGTLASRRARVHSDLVPTL